MSILIKGMKMPSACCDCGLLPEEIEWDGQWECPITEKIVHKYVEERKGKPPDCPLAEVPEPHGRLVDADKLVDVIADAIPSAITNSYDLGFCDGIGRMQIELEDAPTVIEAEVQDHE